MRQPDYAKVFVSILDSTIANNWRARHLFEDLLKLADWRGCVDMTPEAIARRTGWPHGLDALREDLAILNAPDSESRTPDEEGRRIVLLEEGRGWGWRVVNIEAYRNAGDTDRLREQARDRKRRQRAKERETAPEPTSDTPEATIRRVLGLLAPRMANLESQQILKWLEAAENDPWRIAAALCEKHAHLKRARSGAYVTQLVTEKAGDGWTSEYLDAREYVEYALSRIGHA
jgi:hypothetical protein